MCPAWSIRIVRRRHSKARATLTAARCTALSGYASRYTKESMRMRPLPRAPTRRASLAAIPPNHEPTSRHRIGLARPRNVSSQGRRYGGLSHVPFLLLRLLPHAPILRKLLLQLSTTKTASPSFPSDGMACRGTSPIFFPPPTIIYSTPFPPPFSHPAFPPFSHPPFLFSSPPITHQPHAHHALLHMRADPLERHRRRLSRLICPPDLAGPASARLPSPPRGYDPTVPSLRRREPAEGRR